jgi:hypothetical protein
VFTAILTFASQNELLFSMDKRDLHNEEPTHEQLTAWVRRLSDDIGRLDKELAAIRGNAEFMADPLLDSATVCQFLSMSYRQLKVYKQRGEITPLHNGSRCLYPTSEVRRFVQEVLKTKGRKLKTNIIKQEKNYGKE